MLKEFKEFAVRGNAMDLAVAVIVGVAFGAVVTSLVNDVLMPPMGLLLGGIDFKDLFFSLSGASFATLAAAKAAGAPVIAYGQFLNTVINFVIVAFAVFLLIKQLNRFQRPAPAPAVSATRDCPYCLTSIPVAAVRCGHCTSDLRAAGAD